MATIYASAEGPRGCGYRQGGGLYLVAGKLSEPCPKLPIELEVCPTCGEGIKPARGWSWIRPDPLLDPGPHGSKRHEAACPLGTAIDWSEGRRAGLVWIGEKFYPTPGEFMREAAKMGVSRRITVVPRDFVIGETWIALAHRKAVFYPEREEGEEYGPGVFTFFLPEAIEYIVKGDESEDELDRLEERGFRLVKVERLGENLALDDAA